MHDNCVYHHRTIGDQHSAVGNKETAYKILRVMSDLCTYAYYSVVPNTRFIEVHFSLVFSELPVKTLGKYITISNC